METKAGIGVEEAIRAAQELAGSGQPESGLAALADRYGEMQGDWRYLLALGSAYLGIGDLEKAREMAERSFSLNASLEAANALLELAMLRHEPGEAARWAREAAALKPKERHLALAAAAYSEAAGDEEAATKAAGRMSVGEREMRAVMLGSIYARLGMKQELRELVRRVELTEVRSPRRLFELGDACRRVRLDDLAERLYRNVVAAEPHQVGVWERLGMILVDRNKADSAREALDKAIALGRPIHRLRKACASPLIWESEEEIAAWRARAEGELGDYLAAPSGTQDPANDLGPMCFFFAYQGESNRELNRKVAQAVEASCPTLRWNGSEGGSGEGRIRLVFASSFWRDHTVGQITEGLIRELDRSRFEVVGVAPGPPTDETGRRICGLFDRFLTVGSGFVRARETIARLRADAIYFPELGMDPWAYTLGFARMAPVQAMGWGHADTSGLPEIDAMISCTGFEPAEAESFYCEPLERLGRIPCYLGAFEEVSASVEEHLYLCPQSLFKFHPSFDAVMRRILELNPEGRIEVVEGGEKDWRFALEARWKARLGGLAERVRFVKRMSPSDFRAKLASAACVVDTPRFGGGYTLYLAYGLGVPVVVWDGRCLRERMGAAMAEQMGLPELVFSDAESYAAGAVRVACDSGYRADLVSRLRSARGALFDDSAAVREFEDCFERLVRR